MGPVSDVLSRHRLACGRVVGLSVRVRDHGRQSHPERCSFNGSEEAECLDCTSHANPPGSVVQGVVGNGEREGGPGTVDQDVWFGDWPKGYDLTEIARHYSEYDQAFSLLWFEEDDGPSEPVKTFTKAAPSHDEELLRELDGNLPWPGKSKRR